MANPNEIPPYIFPAVDFSKIDPFKLPVDGPPVVFSIEEFYRWQVEQGVTLPFPFDTTVAQPLPPIRLPEIVAETMPVAESLRLTSLVRECLFKSKPACGCDTGICALKRREVVQFECLACVGKFGW